MSAAAPATCYISHAWGASFSDTVDAIEQYDKKNPGTYYWLDLFSLTSPEMKSVDTWCKALKQKLAAGCSMLVVMSFSHSCQGSCVSEDCKAGSYDPLRRSWCLWEMYLAGSSQMRCVAVIPTSNQARAYNQLCTGRDELMAALDRINFSSTMATDKAALLEVIQHDTALHTSQPALYLTKFDRIASKSMRDCLLKTLEAHVEEQARRFTADKKEVAAMSSLGAVYDKYEYYNDAVRCHGQARTYCIKIYGQEDTNAAACFLSLGMAHVRRAYTGDADLGLLLCKRGWENLSRIYGDQHPATLEALSDVATAYSKTKHYDLGRDVLQLLLRQAVIVHGESHVRVALLHTRLGRLLAASGQQARALGHLTCALQILLANVGEAHRLTMECYSDLGKQCVAVVNYAQADTYYTLALRACAAVYGRLSPTYGILLVGRAGIYKAQGDPGRARSVIEAAMALKRDLALHVLPEDAKSFSDVLEAYTKRGAAPLYR